MKALRDDRIEAGAESGAAKIGTDVRRLVSPHFHLRYRSVPVFRQPFIL